MAPCLGDGVLVLCSSAPREGRVLEAMGWDQENKYLQVLLNLVMLWSNIHERLNRGLSPYSLNLCQLEA